MSGGVQHLLQRFRFGLVPPTRIAAILVKLAYLRFVNVLALHEPLDLGAGLCVVPDGLLVVRDGPLVVAAPVLRHMPG